MSGLNLVSKYSDVDGLWVGSQICYSEDIDVFLNNILLIVLIRPLHISTRSWLFFHLVSSLKDWKVFLYILIITILT